MHQGHWDTRPGLYHINAVDTVTPWQVVGCVKTISEWHLAPVLKAMLHPVPFRLRGFHYDNGSEFLSRHVAQVSLGRGPELKPFQRPGGVTLF